MSKMAEEQLKEIIKNAITISFGNNSSSVERKKGRSLIDFPDNFVVIDIETTGLDPSYDEIIEIAALKINSNEIVDKFETLIKPSEPLDEFIIGLTGITNEMLENSPKIQDVLSNFLNFIDNNILVGHNVNFDINFLYDYIMAIYNKPFNNDYIDTMRLTRKLTPELKHHRLKDMVKYFNIENFVAHRAMPDVLATYEILTKSKEMVLKQFESIDDFTRTFKRFSKGIDIKSIVPENNDFDVTHPLYDKLVVFTGTLDRFIRKDAMQYVVNLGGHVKDSITKKTNFLVVGTQDYSRFADGEKSSKLKKAEQYKLEGLDIEIISESIFYDMLEDFYE